jgi:hypothetical protein
MDVSLEIVNIPVSDVDRALDLGRRQGTNIRVEGRLGSWSAL